MTFKSPKEATIDHLCSLVTRTSKAINEGYASIQDITTRVQEMEAYGARLLAFLAKVESIDEEANDKVSDCPSPEDQRAQRDSDQVANIEHRG
jgi:aconitase B